MTLHMIGFAKSQIMMSNRFSLFMESMYATINTMVREQIGSRNEIYLPFIYALFTFILVHSVLITSVLHVGRLGALRHYQTDYGNDGKP